MQGGAGTDLIDVIDGIGGNDTADGEASNQDVCVIDDGENAVNGEA